MDEPGRLETLSRYAILDTAPEPVFDRIAWLAAQHFRAPMGTVGFLDASRQWFKARHGMAVEFLARSDAFCNQTIESQDVLVVPDTLRDDRFRDNPNVTATPAVRFYAGAPLIAPDGARIGTVAVLDYVPRADLDPQDRAILRCLAAMVVEELELRLSASRVRDEIAARRRVEAELRQTQDRFQLSLAHSPVVLFTQDAQLRYTWIANAPLPPERFLGRHDDDVWPEELAQRMTEDKTEVLRTGRRKRIEMALGDPGNPRYFDTTLEPVFADGKVVGLSGAAIDITERRAAKEAASRALAAAEQANRSKSRFLAAASHDLRQPMQSLLLMLGVMKERLKGTPHAQVASHAASAADAMRGLLDSLLDISRIEAGLVHSTPEIIPINPLLKRLKEEYAPRARAKGLEFRLVQCSKSVLTDPALLERILRNLVENALRYTDRGGILVGCRLHDSKLRVDVVDSGIGVDPQFRDSIFDEFVQLANPERDRAKGLGLGLAIVKRLADLLGHPVGVASQPGKGSRFSVEVPTAAAAPVAMAAAELAPEPPVHGSMLVIDDERMVLDALAVTLGGWGIDVTCAESVDQAVAALVDHPAPDAILADYRLRGETTGVQAIEAVRAHCGTYIPSVLITGDTSPRRLAEAKASGHLLLHKPVAPEELRRVVTRLLPT